MLVFLVSWGYHNEGWRQRQNDDRKYFNNWSEKQLEIIDIREAKEDVEWWVCGAFVADFAELEVDLDIVWKARLHGKFELTLSSGVLEESGSFNTESLLLFQARI